MNKNLQKAIDGAKTVIMAVDNPLDMDFPAGAPYDSTAHEDTTPKVKMPTTHERIQEYVQEYVVNNNLDSSLKDYPYVTKSK